jgi:hypothetical protein
VQHQRPVALGLLAKCLDRVHRSMIAPRSWIVHFRGHVLPLPDPSPEANRLIWLIEGKRALHGVEHARLVRVQLQLLACGMLPV